MKAPRISITRPPVPRSHALGSGVMITALVQSSRAVTLAAIGFVNAGLLSLGPALRVRFGINGGTAMPRRARERMAQVLRVLRYYEAATEQVGVAAHGWPTGKGPRYAGAGPPRLSPRSLDGPMIPTASISSRAPPCRSHASSNRPPSAS